MTLFCPKIEKTRTGKTAGSEMMGISWERCMTLLCPNIEKTRTGKTAGSETMGDKLGLFTLVGFFIVLLQVREREIERSFKIKAASTSSRFFG